MKPTFKRLQKFFSRFSTEKQVKEPEQLTYKRSFNRFPIEFEVIAAFLDDDGSEFKERAELRDISGGGALFISRFSEKYYQGQILKLDIFLAGTEDVRACIKTEASVVRIHDPDSESGLESAGKTGIAVKFHKPFEFERIDNRFLR